MKIIYLPVEQKKQCRSDPAVDFRTELFALGERLSVVVVDVVVVVSAVVDESAAGA